MQAARRLLCTVFVMLCAYVCSAGGAAADGAAPSPSPSSSNASAGQSASSGAGSLPIESVILGYEGFQYDADSIADAAEPSLPKYSKILIATESDVAAILQLRVVLVQLAMLSDRLNKVTQLLDDPVILPCAKGIGTPSGHGIARSRMIAPVGVISALSSVATLAQTIASFTSESESVTGQSENFLDNSLINLVASDLVYRERNGYAVYLPSVPANVNGISSAPNLQNTYLLSALQTLDLARRNLQIEAQVKLGAPGCKKIDTKSVRDVVVGAISAADSFEVALFGNGFTLPSTTLVPEAAPKKPQPNQKPNPGGTKPNGISNTINISLAPSPEKPAKAPSAGAGPGVIQKLFYVDLLLSAMRGSTPSSAPLDGVYVLSVHALQAAGSQLTKTQLFLGTRVYYSGGAAATFTLIDTNGSLACSGITYGYRGFVRADDISRALMPDDNKLPDTNNELPSTVSYTPACKNPAVLHAASPPLQR